MRVQEGTIVSTIDYTSGKSGVELDLPRNNPITAIRGRLNIAVGTAAAGTVTNKDGTLLNLIANMRLVATQEGKDVRIATPLKPLFHALTYIGNTGIVKDNAEIAESSLDSEDWSSTSEVFQLAFDLLFPRFAAIEATKQWLQELKLIIDWGSDSDVATAATTNPAFTGTKLHITTQELLFDNEAERQVFARHHIKKTWAETDFAFSNSTVNKYEEQYDIPVGNIVPNLYLNVLDNGVRSDALVTEYQVYDVKNKKQLHQNSWQQSRRTDVNEYRLMLEKIKKGFTVIPLAEIGKTDYRKAAKGDVQVQFNTTGVSTSQDKIQILAEELNAMALRV